jgi:hypothetical protein
MQTDTDVIRQLVATWMVVTKARDAKCALTRIRHLRRGVALDVAFPLRRWSWRARRRVALAVRRVELRASRATERRHFDRGLRKGTIPLTRLLLGEENHVPAADVVRITGRLLHPSTPAPEWPLVLAARTPPARDAHDQLDRIASAHINATGEYFGCRTIGEVHTLVASLHDIKGAVRVRHIRASDCFFVIDGHAAVAGAALRGERFIDVCIEHRQTWTPLQEMLRKMNWLGGRVELYQPISAPEVVNESWPLVRRCTDRFNLMHQFLSDRGLLPPSTSTFLDVGASYGWFVAQMQALGFDARGIDLDPLGRELAAGVFGVTREHYAIGDAALELLRTPPADVVLCLSVAHHFALGRGVVSVEEFRDRLADVTGRVLFFDTGQAHEARIGADLPQWTPDFIRQWLRAGGFDEVVALGTDHDNQPPYKGNYSRMLFACMRHDGWTLTEGQDAHDSFGPRRIVHRRSAGRHD